LEDGTTIQPLRRQRDFKFLLNRDTTSVKWTPEKAWHTGQHNMARDTLPYRTAWSLRAEK